MQALPEGIGVPLTSMDDFDNFEIKAEDAAFQKAMVAVISDRGGCSVDEVVRRSMKFLMKNELERQFNLCGRLGKRALDSTAFFDIIYRATKKNTMAATSSRKDVEKSMSKWLTGARDRAGSRKIRSQRDDEKRKQTIEQHSEDSD